MPFSFPDDTYTSDDKEVTKVIFVFFLSVAHAEAKRA
jgi:hypothetical protein